MQVAVGSQVRGHLFDLARQMERLGYLSHLYTGYPRFKIDDLPRVKVSTFPWLMAPYMAAGRFGFGHYVERLDRVIIRSFDDWVTRNIESCDIYHCLSASGARTHRLVRERYGTLSVCDRPCAHISYQEQIVRDEYDRHGLPFSGFDPYIKERELAEYEFCDLIVVPSAFALRSFVELGVPKIRLRANPLGVDLQVFRPAPKKDSVFRVIYTGRISLEKGLPYLLQALSGLRLANFELWLVGPVRPEMRSILARYEGHFRYLGIIDRNRLHSVYSQGSVFVFPSLQDGFGMVQAEAMACGLPVIASCNTGAPELFTDGIEGFIVPIRDPNAIRDNVLYLYKNPELRLEMAKAALRRVKEMGGWSEYGERAAHIYQEALARRSKSSQAPTAA